MEKAIKLNQVTVVEERLKLDLSQELVLHHVLLYHFLWNLLKSINGSRFDVTTGIDLAELPIALAFSNLKVFFS